MAYMISANMDQGAIDFQLEAAISKVYASVGIASSAVGHTVQLKLYNTGASAPISDSLPLWKPGPICKSQSA